MPLTQMAVHQRRQEIDSDPRFKTGDPWPAPRNDSRVALEGLYHRVLLEIAGSKGKPEATLEWAQSMAEVALGGDLPPMRFSGESPA